MPSKNSDLITVSFQIIYKHTYHYFFRLLPSSAKLEEPQYYFVEMECYGNGLENPGKTEASHKTVFPIHFIQLSPEMASRLPSYHQWLFRAISIPTPPAIYPSQNPRELPSKSIRAPEPLSRMSATLACEVSFPKM